MIRTILLCLLMMVAVLPANARTITVNNDPGGNVLGYAVRVLQAKKDGAQVRINGYCASACTLYLHLPSRQLCVGKNASFHFHAPYIMVDGKKTVPKSIKSYMMKMYPGWVQSWVNSKGGLTGKLIPMDYNVIRKHIRQCN